MKKQENLVELVTRQDIYSIKSYTNEYVFLVIASSIKQAIDKHNNYAKRNILDEKIVKIEIITPGDQLIIY